jgi:hypothetical protein
MHRKEKSLGISSQNISFLLIAWTPIAKKLLTCNLRAETLTATLPPPGFPPPVSSALLLERSPSSPGPSNLHALQVRADQVPTRRGPPAAVVHPRRAGPANQAACRPHPAGAEAPVVQNARSGSMLSARQQLLAPDGAWIEGIRRAVRRGPAWLGGRWRRRGRWSAVSIRALSYRRGAKFPVSTYQRT